MTDLPSIKKAAVRLNTATAVPAAQADGLAAAAVASTMLLGWYAKVRGRQLKPLTVTMFATGTPRNARPRGRLPRPPGYPANRP